MNSKTGSHKWHRCLVENRWPLFMTQPGPPRIAIYGCYQTKLTSTPTRGGLLTSLRRNRVAPQKKKKKRKKEQTEPLRKNTICPVVKSIPSEKKQKNLKQLDAARPSPQTAEEKTTIFLARARRSSPMPKSWHMYCRSTWASGTRNLGSLGPFSVFFCQK